METTITTPFQEFLSRFNNLIKESPAPQKVKEDLNKLKEDAKNSKELTYWQMDAIIKRCSNYLLGKYGVSDKKQQYMNDNN